MNTIQDLEQHRESLYFCAYKILKNRDDAADAAQDTLILAHAKFDQFDPSKAQLTTWLQVICKNVALQYLRKNRNFRYADDSELEFEPADMAEYNDVSDLYNQVLAFAKDSEILSKYGLNDAFVEYYLNKGAQGENLEDIAARFNMNHATIRTVFTRTKLAIRKSIKIPEGVYF